MNAELLSATVCITITAASATTAINATTIATIFALLGFAHDEPPSLVFEVIETLDC